MLDREEPRDGRACQDCGITHSRWRCLDCLGRPSLCAECCTEKHLLHPFHRVESWKGTHYSPNWLWAAGVCIHLGHNGQPCPTPMFEHPDGDTTFGEHEQDWHDANADFSYNAVPPEGKWNGGRVVTVVHTNGVHHLPVIRCGCEGRSNAVINDFLQLGMLPASFDRIETVFTTDVLENSLLSFLECSTTANSFFNKLRRLTNYAFPESVKVRRNSSCWTHCFHNVSEPLYGVASNDSTMASHEGAH